VDLHGKTKVATTQMEASHDISSTKVWEFGACLNVGKQLTDGLNMEFGQYYRHRATHESAEFVLDGDKTEMDRTKDNEYGFRVAETF
jgi:outer membrane protein